jgi:Flp pilus assembly protein CpaB
MYNGLYRNQFNAQRERKENLMRRGRTWLLILLLVVIIGGAAAYFIFSGGGGIFGAPAATPTVAVRQVEVVVAGQQIPKLATIDENMLSTVLLPESNVVSTMIRDKAQVVGKYAKYQLDQGHFITTADIATSALEVPQGGSEAARLIPNGMVAISIPMTRLGSAAYGVQDGDHVNLILTALFVDVDPGFQSILPNTAGSVTLAPGSGQQTASVAAGSPVGRTEIDPVLNAPIYVIPSEAQRPRMVSQMILQDIQVLHVGNFPQAGVQAAPQPTPEPGATPAPTPAPTRPDVVTLIVNPQDAVTLTYLMFSGLQNGAQMTMVLRGADDQSRVQTESATLQFLLSQYGITIPAKLSNAMNPVLNQLAPPAWHGDDQVTVNP